MLLGAAPWRRAPWLLLRTPGVFLACVLTMGVLAMAASSGVLFLSSAGTAALRNEAAQECPESAQPGITNDPGPSHLPSRANTPAALRRATARVPAAMLAAGLPVPDVVAEATVPISANQSDVVTLLARDEVVRHVSIIDSTPGSGVFVPQSLAEARRLRVGGRIALGSRSARVVGIYRDLAPSAFVPLFRLPRYWCTWRQQIVPTPFNRPAPLVLTDLATLEATASTITANWYAPIRVDSQTVPQVKAALAATSTALRALDPHGESTYRSVTDLSYLLGKAERERTGLAGAVIPVDVAGTLVAGLLVAAAGAFWGVRRQRELQLLGSRGVGGSGIAMKAAAEATPAIALGTAGGWLAALVLVMTLGPASQLEPGAAWRALGLAGVAAAGGLVTFGVLGARALPSDAAAGARRRWPRYVPWELTLLAASVLTYERVRRDGAVHVAKATVQINPLVLAFPLLALTGAVLLLARAGTTGLKRAGTAAGHLPAAAYLAVRRLTGTPAVAVGTLVGVAVPIAVLVYSAALSGSTSDDLHRKYETNVGAEHAFGTLAAPGSTPALHGTGTVVSMIQTGVYIDDGTEVRVVGVDPATFTEFAYQGSRLRDVLSRLSATGPTADALMVNAAPATVATRLDIRTPSRTATVAIRIVGTSASFPGERNPYAPLLVVNRAALPTHLPPLTDRNEEVWTTTASAPAALAALRRDGVDPNYEITPNSFLDNTGLRPVTWIFGYLRALAYLTGLVAVTALAFAFTARTRRRALSYYLARRMGLSAASHRRSIALELGGLLVISWTAGVALAAAAVALVYRLADAYPNSPPPPQYPVPTATIVATAAAATAVGIVGTQLLQHLLDRMRPDGLLRA